MNSSKTIKKLSACLLLIPLLVTSTALFAQRIVESGDRSAGFRFATDDTVNQPVIHYQQNIQMLAGIDDRPTFKVYGSGRVLVHYPVYMKKAGDYEMQLDETELVALIQSLSSNGIMTFDEKKVKEKITGHKKALKAKGQFYEISDAVENVIEISLDEYQENKTSKKIKKFYKRFTWKNIEHDALRYKDEIEITRANSSVEQFRTLMKDRRLIKIEQR